jgi:CheY-like chemotaxis protein
VLVVDDDIEIRDLLTDVLAGTRFEARCAAGGQEALDILQQEDGWIILLDLMMPEVDGIALLRTLLARPQELGNNQIVLMTASGRLRQDDARWLEGLVHAFLPKPFDVEEVLDLIQRLAHEAP